eukprot:gene14937-20093_t
MESKIESNSCGDCVMDGKNVEQSEYHNFFMRLALNQAELALNKGEVPVGCVFVSSNTHQIISYGHNMTNDSRNGTRHAELVAIDNAIFKNNVDPNDFLNSSLYVTCEPCIMCAAALVKMKIKAVYFGCHNDRFGGNGSILSVQNYDVIPCIMKDESINIFQTFYESENRRAPDAKRRKKNK